jgi:K+-sensing histidine kinase KdpD
MISKNDVAYFHKEKEITAERKRKTAQYLGEGITFFLLIIAGAVFIFRIIKRQFIQSRQQQNFIMAITHELKTPIAVTKLNLETMQKRKLDFEQQQKLIRTTIQEANRLNALCNNILLLSQIDSGGYSFINEKFDLANLANECVSDFKIRFPYRKIHADIQNNISISGDRFLLQLAINNLLDNAIKYSTKEDVILLKLFKENKLIKLQTIDEGQGITSTEKERIFDKYFRGETRQAKGTGLGLYLTKEIVKQHHGDISMIDNIPRGSIFEITLKSKNNNK